MVIQPILVLASAILYASNCDAAPQWPLNRGSESPTRDFEPLMDTLDGINGKSSLPLQNTDLYRPAPWGEINFLHTTDTHGWLAGHMLEKQFQGDWGDFVSFVTHVRENAAERGKDVVVVDTGDRHDGNGLSDASDVPGEYTSPLFGYVGYDLITIGNHELYRGQVAISEFMNSRKRFGDKFVVSNVEVRESSSLETWDPMGNKYRIWQLPNTGKRVLGLGFLFNFGGSDSNNARVIPIEQEITKPWFQSLLQNEISAGQIDVILLACHAPVRDVPEIAVLFNAIRAANSTIPIAMLGGHSHIRDFKVYDKTAVALESGRFCETIGWLGLNLTNKVEFDRQYLDFSRSSFSAHCEFDQFDTPFGLEIKDKLKLAREKLNLDEIKACAPQSWYTDRADVNSKRSIFRLLRDHVLPLLPLSDPEESRMILINTGLVRFDLMRGPYTRDSAFIVSPFKNEWQSIHNLTSKQVSEVTDLLNSGANVLKFVPPNREFVSNFKGLTRGYVTHDDFGNSGDDLEHIPWKFYHLPNVVVTAPPKQSLTQLKLVFPSFVGPFILDALSYLGHNHYEILPYGGPQLGDLLPAYLSRFKECLPS